jgi:hypothetical protein
MNKKRTSMKGMGADTFFETPVSQQDDMQASQHDDKPVSQDASIPASHQTSKPVGQQTGKTVSQPTGSAGEEQLIKATFYLTQEHIMKLEHIRIGRKQKGTKVDKSALVREAIDLLGE